MTQARDVMILISKEAGIMLDNVTRDKVGRFVDIQYGEGRITIANLYTRNLDSPGFF